MKIALIYVPFPSFEEASKVSNNLINRHLIACANIITSDSQYIWQGEFCSENEWIAIMKTSLEILMDVEIEIEKLHSYDTPAIIQWEVSANEKYAKWIASQTTAHRQ